VLTHHPEDATPADGVTFLDCDPAEAVRVGLKAARGKNLAVLSPTIGRQLLELGLIDEIDLHVAPVLLGDGEPAPRPLVNSAQVRMTSALRVRGACRKRPLNRDAEP
jgi:dihydrofolate reductase